MLQMQRYGWVVTNKQTGPRLVTCSACSMYDQHSNSIAKYWRNAETHETCTVDWDHGMAPATSHNFSFLLLFLVQLQIRSQISTRGGRTSLELSLPFRFTTFSFLLTQRLYCTSASLYFSRPLKVGRPNQDYRGRLIHETIFLHGFCRWTASFVWPIST